MIIFSYNLALLLIYPIIAFIGFLRFFLNKENSLSFKQKFFANYNYNEFQNIDILIHFASIGELNSIKYLLDNLNNKNILLTCSTLSAYNLSKDRYPHIKIIFLPIDFKWNVQKFVANLHLKKILWIDSEIWPNWLIQTKKANIKNILINGRLSNKSYSNWRKIKSFSEFLGKKYELIFAKSSNDKDKLNDIFQRDIHYLGNLKFYLEIDISKIKKNILCFASIHKAEFDSIIKIIKKLNLNLFESIIIIPRHIQFSNKLRLMINGDFKNKIQIHDKFGDNLPIFDRSKIVFMGGSLINHGGQNPLEPLSRGCYITCGKNNDNFKDQYLDLERFNLATIFNNNLDEISLKINDLIELNFDNNKFIDNYFKDNTKNFKKMIEMIKEC